MKSLFFATVFICMVSACQTQVPSGFVHYTSAFEEIKVTPDSLFHTIITSEYDNPVSSVPSSSTSKTNAYKIENYQFTEVQQYIENAGFWNLNDAFGAPENERYYPYEISVKWGDKTKKALYRSSPGAEAAPSEFQNVVKYLQDWVAKQK